MKTTQNPIVSSINEEMKRKRRKEENRDHQHDDDDVADVTRLKVSRIVG